MKNKIYILFMVLSIILTGCMKQEADVESYMNLLEIETTYHPFNEGFYIGSSPEIIANNAPYIFIAHIDDFRLVDFEDWHIDAYVPFAEDLILISQIKMIKGNIPFDKLALEFQTDYTVHANEFMNKGVYYLFAPYWRASGILYLGEQNIKILPDSYDPTLPLDRQSAYVYGIYSSLYELTR